MINVKIYELDKHRNETTFRPYIQRADYLRDVGINIVNHNDYDFAWIGQASIADKKLPLDESVQKGIEFCNNIGGDYMIFDGQDSHSMIGVYEVFIRLSLLSSERCLLLLKNTLLKDYDMYKEPTVNGRWYWGEGNYSNPDIDMFKDRIVLSGTNWLHTMLFKFIDDYENIPKKYDVCGLFGYHLTQGSEHGLEHHQYYNNHRKPCVDALLKLKDRGRNVQVLSDGQRVPPDEYHQIMATSKIVVAPYGYGEMAPRDLQAISYGSILIKPTMEHLVSEPWVYHEGATYIGCAHDYSDLEEKVEYVLNNFRKLQSELTANMREQYRDKYMDPYRMPMYLADVFANKLTGIVEYGN